MYGHWILGYSAAGAGAQTATGVQQPPESPDAGTISGTITDSDGALVAGAKVTLAGAGTRESRSFVTGEDGQFHFIHIPAGEFTLKVSAGGLAPTSVAVTLGPGQIFETPAIALRVASANSEVMVTLSPEEIAEAEVKAEEQQRVIGFIPNYFVSYDKNPEPLNAKQKFGLGFHVVFDPTNFLFAGLSAGIEQANDTIPGYGGGAQGFGKRYGAALALSSSSTLFRGSIYPALFRQDPRYFYKGTGTFWGRARYAVATAVICKGDNGRWQPNYSGILGDLSAGALANAYYPASSRNGAALTFENGLLSTAGVGVGHLLQEFLFRHVTTHAQRTASTQP
jgi:hypothetical protein